MQVFMVLPILSHPDVNTNSCKEKITERINVYYILLHEALLGTEY